MIEYVVSPGDVWSREDGQRHHIGYSQLIHLYHVDPRVCIIDDGKGSLREYDGEFLKTLIWLKPRLDGNYSLD